MMDFGASRNKDNENQRGVWEDERSSFSSSKYKSGSRITYQVVNQSPLPFWLTAEKMSFWERLELMFFKLISFMPVTITVGLFSFLFIFYSYVSSAPFWLVSRSP